MRQVCDVSSTKPSSSSLNRSSILKSRPRQNPRHISWDLATHALESLPSPCLALVVGFVQAIACAQSGAAVISPFIGRLEDWWDLNKDPTNGVPSVGDHLGSNAGVRSRGRIHWRERRPRPRTAAGFRTVDEVVELGKFGRECGPDLITLPSRWMWKRREEIRTQSSALHVHLKSTTSDFLRRPRYLRITLDKVSEGLEMFNEDARVLEARVGAALELLNP